MQKILKSLSVVVLTAFLAVPLVVSAAIGSNFQGGGGAFLPNNVPAGVPGYFANCTQNNGTGAIACLVGNIISILLAVVFFIAVVFLIIGGFRYIISQGNEEGVEKAKGTITNSIIGIVVVLLAWIIVRVVVSLLETQPS